MGRDVAVLRPQGGPAERRALYRALASAIATAPPPAGGVFEIVAPSAVPIALVRPARLAEALRTAADARIEPVPPAPRPPDPLPSRIGSVVPAAGPELRELVPPPAPALDRVLGPGGWLATQTFWIGDGRGSLWIARRFRLATPDPVALVDRFSAVAHAVATDTGLAVGRPAGGTAPPAGSRWAWRRRTLGGHRRHGWRFADPAIAAATAELSWLVPSPDPAVPAGHTVVFGTSGAGKTTYLADRAARAMGAGERVVAIDLHGDLAPAIAARLAEPERRRVVAIDADRSPVPGVAALPPGGDERAAGLLVAAVKRLSADGSDVYWGFRLERIFDTMVRLVQESGGSLLDLYDLLTRDERRDVARLATRRPELARFLEELAPIVRRTPDYLWPAATRLSKVALVPALAELLAPPDGGVPIESLLQSGRSILIRLPFARIGPEAAALAATFVLARVFLGVAGTVTPGPAARGLLLVLDEVHGFSPRLVAEVLAESRKFGIRALVASQYPERLAGEVRSAASGAAARSLVFRVPPPSAAEAGAWIGLDRAVAERLLPTLPTGEAIEMDPERGGVRSIAPVAPGGAAPEPWAEAVARTQLEYAPARRGRDDASVDPLVERLLLAVLAAEERGAPLAPGDVPSAALGLPGPAVDLSILADRWAAPRIRSLVEPVAGRCHLSPAGERWLGLGAPTGAARETAEHRRLLLATFRIFARHGARLEIVRQGRFDTTVPDARFRLLPAVPESPEELGERIDRARATWAWRFFGGRDVHVEAEVSGALRAERIRHGWTKGRDRGAYVLFVVGDARRARRVRAVLDREGAPRGRAGVWTLPAARPNP